MPEEYDDIEEFDAEDDDCGPSEKDLSELGDQVSVCPKCREQVYDDVEQCPYCGYWMTDKELATSWKPKRGLGFKIILIIIVAMMIMGVLAMVLPIN